MSNDEKRMEEMQEQMESTMSQMKKDIDAMTKEFQSRANEAMNMSRDKIRERPLTAVGVAFGAGLVIGAILIKALDRD